MNSAAVLIFAILFFTNLGISWYNAKLCGRVWAEAKALGGWPWFLAWCGAVMAACGFTDCYLILLGSIAHGLGYLPEKYLELSFKLGYLLTLLPVLGSGLVIWANSLILAWRERDLKSAGFAAWNTLAMAHNAFDAVTSAPEAFNDLLEAFANRKSGGDSDWGKGDTENKLLFLAVLLALFALFAGVMTTVLIIKAQAGVYAAEIKQRVKEMQDETGQPA